MIGRPWPIRWCCWTLSVGDHVTWKNGVGPATLFRCAFLLRLALHHVLRLFPPFLSAPKEKEKRNGSIWIVNSMLMSTCWNRSVPNRTETADPRADFFPFVPNHRLKSVKLVNSSLNTNKQSQVKWHATRNSIAVSAGRFRAAPNRVETETCGRLISHGVGRVDRVDRVDRVGGEEAPGGWEG